MLEVVLNHNLFRKSTTMPAAFQNYSKSTMATALDCNKREMALSNRKYKKYDLQNNMSVP